METVCEILNVSELNDEDDVTHMKARARGGKVNDSWTGSIC